MFSSFGFSRFRVFTFSRFQLNEVVEFFFGFLGVPQQIVEIGQQVVLWINVEIIQQVCQRDQSGARIVLGYKVEITIQEDYNGVLCLFLVTNASTLLYFLR